MALEDGDDFLDGSILSYQEANRLKNHWRGAAAPSNIQPGMIFSDSDDDKLYHIITGSVEEQILQATKCSDVTPHFDKLRLEVETNDALSDPPTAAELAATFGSVPEGFIGTVRNSSSGALALWLCHYVGATWWVMEFSPAV